MVRARWNGVVVAESADTVIIDGKHYFPAEAVNREYLVPSRTTTVCPWKGRASYYSLRVDGAVNRDAAWYYPAPSTAASSVAGTVSAFWHGVTIEDEGTGARRRSLFDRFLRSPAVPEEPAMRDPARHGAEPGRSRTPVVDVGDTSFFCVLAGASAASTIGEGVA